LSDLHQFTPFRAPSTAIPGVSDTLGLAFEEQFRGTRKMETIRQVTGGIAHEFNNLLLAINLNLEALADEIPASNATLSLFDGAHQAIEQARDLIRQLLAFSKRQPLNPANFDLNHAVVEACTLMRLVLPPSIEVKSALARDAGLAFADRGQLEVALLNLALNAADAMPQGGRVTVGSARTRPSGSGAVVTVTDTGFGMAPDIVERAFEPFSTTKAELGRSGLGLSQVYGFAKQSGGHAEIDGGPGGTTVRLLLPGGRAAAPPRPAMRAPRKAARGETILLVEDTALVRHAVGRMLEDLGYKVIAASGAEEALAFIENVSRIDLLFTDVTLPGGAGGEELAAAARRLRPALRVLYTSGYTEIRIDDLVAGDPSSALIAKPYSKSELARELRTLLDEETAPG